MGRHWDRAGQGRWAQDGRGTALVFSFFIIMQRRLAEWEGTPNPSVDDSLSAF